MTNHGEHEEEAVMKIIKRIICAFRGHDYTTWRRAIRPGGLVPMAACDRCGLVP